MPGPEKPAPHLVQAGAVPRQEADPPGHHHHPAKESGWALYFAATSPPACRRYITSPFSTSHSQRPSFARDEQAASSLCLPCPFASSLPLAHPFSRALVNWRRPRAAFACDWSLSPTCAEASLPLSLSTPSKTSRRPSSSRHILDQLGSPWLRTVRRRRSRRRTSWALS